MLKGVAELLELPSGLNSLNAWWRSNVDVVVIPAQSSIQSPLSTQDSVDLFMEVGKYIKRAFPNDSVRLFTLRYYPSKDIQRLKASGFLHFIEVAAEASGSEVGPIDTSWTGVTKHIDIDGFFQTKTGMVEVEITLRGDTRGKRYAGIERGLVLFARQNGKWVFQRYENAGFSD